MAIFHNQSYLGTISLENLRQVATQLKSSNYQMYQLHFTMILIEKNQIENLRYQYGITKFPSILLFKSQQFFPYNGGLKQEQLLNWVQQKIIMAPIYFNSTEELLQFKTHQLTQGESIIIYSGDLQRELENFHEISLKIKQKDPRLYFGVLNFTHKFNLSLEAFDYHRQCQMREYYNIIILRNLTKIYPLKCLNLPFIETEDIVDLK
ncbi:UNKNOWN [Stylonychia lemnae]|uniref:Thioredoxin domain-containing protein n=1 Tax=Stylonychia lemnae TaxID=5949 RepID=A0A078B2H1_STYLE|nr:UNKNOWN [Stylonychia lemnae]|eukprot:CDW88431.1 UNKNOWN [Stylonychia lemnae]